MNQTLGTHQLPSIYRLADVLSAVKNDGTPNPLKRYIPDQFANTNKSLTENIPTKAKFPVDVDHPVQQTRIY